MEHPPTLLADLVGKADMSHAEIVEGYQACAREHGEDATITVRTLRRWMAGDVRTNARPAQRRVARLYWGHSMTQLLGPAEIEYANLTTTHETVERRMAMSVRRATQFVSLAETANIGPETIDQLRDEMARLANACIREPLADLIDDLIALQDNVFTLLEGKQRPAQSRDLYLVAGAACGLLAKASHDLARPHDAIAHARTMFVCAENAGHIPMQAWARGQQAVTAYWAGWHDEAARHAASGSALLAGHHAGTVTAWLPALEARAQAQLNRPELAHSALRLAAEARDSIAPDDLDGVGGIFTFPLAKQRYYAAGTYVHLEGTNDAAVTEATEALSLFEGGDYRSFADEAGSRAELALGHLHNGDLDGAREVMTDVLALEPNRRIRGLIATVERLHSALRDPRFFASPTARDLRQEIEAYCRATAAGIK